MTERKVGLPLQQLKLAASGGSNFDNDGYSSDIFDVFQKLERSWRLTRNIRDDHDEIEVYELGTAARKGCEIRKKQNEEYLENMLGMYQQRPKHTTPKPRSVMEVFLKIWPSEKGVKGWKDAWSSFPLPTTWASQT